MESMPNILTVLLVGFFYLVFNAGFIGFALFPTLKARKARSWPTVQGQVESSEIVWRASSEGGSTEYPDVHYSYKVMGQSYQSDRIMPGGHVGGMISHSIVKRYPAGGTVTVYYNPENPSESLLESRTPGYVKFLWMAVVIGNLIFCCCGFLPLTGSSFGTPLIQGGIKLLFELIGMPTP